MKIEASRQQRGAARPRMLLFLLSEDNQRAAGRKCPQGRASEEADGIGKCTNLRRRVSKNMRQGLGMERSSGKSNREKTQNPAPIPPTPGSLQSQQNYFPQGIKMLSKDPSS